MQTPTSETYAELQEAYTHFNRELFAGQLPECLITLQRRKFTYGYLSYNRFVNMDGETAAEIAMNPAYFATRSIEDLLSTLVHEMSHLWQFTSGRPGRGRYHNKEWADKMKKIGLHPSNTGQPGGKETGDQMDHYIIDDGLFQKSTRRLLTEEFHFSWYDRFPAMELAEDKSTLPILEKLVSLGIDQPGKKETRKINSKVKFTCPSCHANAWGKSSLKIACSDCNLPMQ